MSTKFKKTNSKVQVSSINTLHYLLVDYNYVTQGDIW